MAAVSVWEKYYIVAAHSVALPNLRLVMVSQPSCLHTAKISKSHKAGMCVCVCARASTCVYVRT